MSSDESDVKIYLAKLSIAYQSHGSLINLIKWNGMEFFPSCSCVNAIVWMHHMDANKTHGEKARWEPHKNATWCLEQILKAMPHKTAAVQSLTSYLKKLSK